MKTKLDILKENPSMSNIDIGELFVKYGHSRGSSEAAVRALRRKHNLRKIYPEVDVGAEIENDFIDSEKKYADKKFHSKYKHLLQSNDELKKELGAVIEMKKTLQSHTIVATDKTKGEAVAVVVASDWHVEEIVRAESVNGKNAHNLDIATARAEQFFVNFVKLLQKEQQAIVINKVVLALLGDFISGNIHEELLSNCSLPPVKAMIFSQNLIYSGIKYVLANTKVDILIPCHVGNHPRITKKVNISNEQGNSLEYYMYHVLANAFAKEKRITFIIAESYHTYLKIYDKTLRLHHGHSIKYGGGVGGLTICTNKAIAQWNKTLWADIDVFGHLHQSFDGGNFIANGSNIGYNTFAITIKASYEPPRQQFFLVDAKRGKTVVAPVVYSV